jgi:hypothetical protein
MALASRIWIIVLRHPGGQLRAPGRHLTLPPMKAADELRGDRAQDKRIGLRGWIDTLLPVGSFIFSRSRFDPWFP